MVLEKKLARLLKSCAALMGYKYTSKIERGEAEKAVKT